MDRALLLLVCVLALAPALIRVAKGWTAGSTPRKIAGDAIPALSVPVLLFGVVVPGTVRFVLIAIGVLLAVWDTVNDVRSWRRSKAAAAPLEASPPRKAG